MYMKPVSSCDTVNLSDRIAVLKQFCHLHKRIRSCLNLKVAGDPSAYLLRIDNRRVFLDNAFLLQRLHPHFDRHTGNADLLPDLRVGHPRVLNQEADNLLIQFIQSIQKHLLSPPALHIDKNYKV